MPRSFNYVKDLLTTSGRAEAKVLGDTESKRSAQSVANGFNQVHVLWEPSEAFRATIIADIVFVHGLTGTFDATWYQVETSEPWPKTLLSQDLRDCRMLSYSYDANVVHGWNPVSQNCIADHARNLLGALSRKRGFTSAKKRPIVFVAHSLGGLVVQETMNLSWQSPEEHLSCISEAAIGIIFMGTPHHGSRLADWAEFGTNLAKAFTTPNKDILGVLRPGSEMLASIQDRFHTAYRKLYQEKGTEPLRMTCFYEELAWRGLGTLIVTKDSAKIPGHPNYGIHANHTNMTKFSSREDSGYEALHAEISRWIWEARYEIARILQQELPMPQLVRAAELEEFVEFKSILDYQNDPNVRDAEHGRTPLHIAACNGRQKNMEALLNAGADINSRDFAGLTPVSYACMTGKFEAVWDLLQAGADVNVVSDKGATPLIVATVNCQSEVIRLLLQRGADKAVRAEGWSALDIALAKKDRETISALLEE